MPEFYVIFAQKVSKCSKFFMTFARKNNKIQEFYVPFARKMLEFYTTIVRKIFFHNFGGHVPPASPVSYAVGRRLW